MEDVILDRCSQCAVHIVVGPCTKGHFIQAGTLDPGFLDWGFLDRGFFFFFIRSDDIIGVFVLPKILNSLFFIAFLFSKWESVLHAVQQLHLLFTKTKTNIPNELSRLTKEHALARTIIRNLTEIHILQLTKDTSQAEFGSQPLEPNGSNITTEQIFAARCRPFCHISVTMTNGYR
jgi:hypothetical protein